MEKSSDASPENPDEQTHDNGITIDKEDGTRSKEEPILIGRSENCNNEKTSQPVEDKATSGSNGEGSCLLSSDEIKKLVANFLATLPAESSRVPSNELRPSSDNIFRTSIGKEPVDNGITKFSPGRSSKHSSKFYRLSSSMKKKASAKSKSSGSNSRKIKTPQSIQGRGVPEPVTNAEKSNPAAHASSSKERRKRKKKFRENASDVFTKMRNHVRYILNKIKYEQSLIDAYGGEGWKGMSIDKLKPEKELQRASSEILRCKLRLRDLFQRLDALCAEGAYPKSMFDSEGLLDTEDIYCTICGSKEISANNDIVLCDGECNRAFHQLCLKPPLLTEEIPPEDQGWLCPGCDCKFDCTELLNNFFGSELSVKDDWTKIFPEAAAAGANIIDEILRLPSDDSEDDDFNPENMDVEEKDQSGEKYESYEGEESASDESDFSSASEDLGDFINKGQLVEKLTNNVEEDDEDDDDDYDPEAPDPDNLYVGKKVEVEKLTCGGESSEGEGSASDESDFSSASEDLGDFVCKQLAGNNPDKSEDTDDDFDPDAREPNQQNEESSSSDFLSDSNAISAELDNITSTKNSDLVVAETEQESPVPGSKKRGIERLDYKKLHDEAYGNMSLDSSDDEDWSEVGPSRKKTDRVKRDDSTALKSKKRGSVDEEQPMDTETKPQEAKDVASRRSGKKPKSSSGNGSMAKGSRSSMGETAIQKLTEAFQKNHYPERAVKEGLANDLGLSYQKVDKWFGNARWSFNHPLHARTVSKSNLATKSPPQTKSGSQVAIVNNSSKSHSSQNRPEAKTTVSETSIKIPSPPNPTCAKAKGKNHFSQNRPEAKTTGSDADTTYKISSPPNPTSDNAEGKRGRGKTLTSPNSSTTVTTIQGDASNPPVQPNTRRSSRLQESFTSNACRDDANNGSIDNGGRGSPNAGESNTTKGNSKQRGKKAPWSTKK